MVYILSFRNQFISLFDNRRIFDKFLLENKNKTDNKRAARTACFLT